MLVLRVDPKPGTISHFMSGIDGFDPEQLRTRLADQGRSLAGMPRVSMSATRTDWTSRWDGKGLGLSTGIVENGFKLR